jgi:anti-sigma factor ChrR (cupin superfamily)
MPEEVMAALTPHLARQERLDPLASRYVNVTELPWQDTPWPGIFKKVLLEDKDSGLVTLLMRMEPGARLPSHEHTRIEQTYVLEGSLKDDQGEATAGNFVWRPAGSRHTAWAPDGALLIGFFLQPNRFLD